MVLKCKKGLFLPCGGGDTGVKLWAGKEHTGMHCSDLLNHHLIGQVVLLGYSKERWVVSYLKKEEQNVHIELREPFSERSTGRSGCEIDFQVDQTTLCEEGRTFSITYKGKEGVTYFTFELPQEFKLEAFAA